MKKLTTFLALSLLITASTLCETSVWVVSTDSSVTYIGGAVHILRESDRPFPPEFELAYNASEILVLETDYSKLASPEFQQAVLAKGVYSDGRTLDEVLTAETYQRLEECYAKYDIAMAPLRQLKPSLVVTTLTMLGLQRLGVDQEGIDAFYHSRAIADNKPTAGLETVAEQIEVLTTMGDGNEDAFVVHTIEEMEILEELFDDMALAWKTGDESAMVELFLKEMKQDFPKLFRSLMVDRNLNWMPGIEGYIVTPETEFVLVGVAHLVGEEGVIAQLRELGYKVERLK